MTSTDTKSQGLQPASAVVQGSARVKSRLEHVQSIRRIEMATQIMVEHLDRLNAENVRLLLAIDRTRLQLRSRGRAKTIIARALREVSEALLPNK
jgi:hypothetical protein